MVLSDNTASRQIIGSLMINPLLFLEYPDLTASDFDLKIGKICFVVIRKLFDAGAQKLTPIEVDQEIEKYNNSAIIYRQENGLEFLKAAYEYAEPSNFGLYYARLKKYALLRRLKKEHYDISDFYIEDGDPRQETDVQLHFEAASLEDILNAVETKYNIIRNDFLNNGKASGDPSSGIFALIDELQKTPNIGPSIEGKIFSSACRGARPGCFYLKSASTAAGKTRTSVFDACRLAYPERWSFEKETFISIVDRDTGECCAPRKVLFIVTEMDKEELQTIMLAYLSGVNEAHILTGQYELGELSRVKYAARIMEKYSGYFYIEEISEPNLVNVEAAIKKYATLYEVGYVFFDYIHSTASLINEFAKNSLGEHTILMMFANQLKQLAKDYNLFIFSATQVNATAMGDDGEFKNEMSIRGSKAVSDKCDVGYVMTKVNEKLWNSVVPTLRQAARAGKIDANILEFAPTHVIDIYKMRRGQFKNVRIWIYLHLGTGQRKDLFITTADNQPIEQGIDLFSSELEWPTENWMKEVR